MLAFLVTFVVQQECMVSIRIKLGIGKWFVFAHSNESISPCTTTSRLINWNFQIGGHVNKLAASRRALLVCLGARAHVFSLKLSSCFWWGSEWSLTAATAMAMEDKAGMLLCPPAGAH